MTVSTGIAILEVMTRAIGPQDSPGHLPLQRSTCRPDAVPASRGTGRGSTPHRPPHRRAGPARAEEDQRDRRPEEVLPDSAHKPIRPPTPREPRRMPGERGRVAAGTWARAAICGRPARAGSAPGWPGRQVGHERAQLVAVLRGVDLSQPLVPLVQAEPALADRLADDLARTPPARRRTPVPGSDRCSHSVLISWPPVTSWMPRCWPRWAPSTSHRRRHLRVRPAGADPADVLPR